MTTSELESLKIIADKRRTYYSIEIYPPDMYDPKFIIKNQSSINDLTSNESDYIDLLNTDNPHINQNNQINNNLISFTTTSELIQDNPPQTPPPPLPEKHIINTQENQTLPRIESSDIINQLYEIDGPIDHNKDKLQDIIFYMKTEWLKNNKPITNNKKNNKDNNNKDINDQYELPFYKYTEWPTMPGDMLRLSNKFKDWMFVIYGKSELFIDNIYINIYRNGRLEHCSGRIEIDIKLKMPNGTYKTVDREGLIKLDPTYDVSNILIPREKGLESFAHIATDMTVLLGNTITDLGSFAAEGAIAAAIIANALKIVDAMHQNVIRYGDNKGKCKFLYDRCNNIAKSLQQIPNSTIDLKFVTLVIEKLTQARDLIEEYGKQWKITRFLGSSANKRKFDDMHSDLDSSFHDFGVNLQVDRKLFNYKQ